MTTEQRTSPHHASAATVKQAPVARGHTMRIMDHEQRSSDDHAEHCGFLFPECESYVDQCGSQWTNDMGRVLARPSESVVAAASNFPIWSIMSSGQALTRRLRSFRRILVKAIYTRSAGACW
jgi:hypothetical protein